MDVIMLEEVEMKPPYPLARDSKMRQMALERV